MRRNHVFSILFVNAAIPFLMAQTTPASKPATAAKPAASSTSTAKPAAKPVAKPATPAPMTEDQKIIYSLGLSIYKSLQQFNLSPAELEIVKKGISDAATKKPALDLDTYGPKIRGFQKDRADSVSKEYLTKAAAAPGVVKTDSGMIFKDLVVGTGPSPKATDNVKVNYRGTLTDGTEFDSSYKRNEPAEFPLNRVIACWTEGVQKMKVGGKARLVCPSSIAYGDSGQPPTIPGGATLIFEVELLGITDAK